MRARIAAAFVALALGCHDEPEPAPAELAELCGELGPLKILEVEPWRVAESAQPLGVFGDRRLFRVLYQDASFGNTSLWSTGLCGEEPRSLLSGYYLSRIEVPAFPDIPFVCDTLTGRIFVVDPTGERAPKVVFELDPYSCYAERTDAGLAVIRPGIDETLGAAILLPYPDDPWTDEVAPRVLLDGVRTAYAISGAYTWDALQADDDGLFAITAEQELVRVNVNDGSVELVADGVIDFALSWEVDEQDDDGWAHRYVLVQRAELVNDDPEWPISELVLLDRETGDALSLGDGFLRVGPNPFSWSHQGVMLASILTDGELRPRLYHPPSPDYVELPTSLDYLTLLGDDRQFLVGILADETWGIFDSETAELRRLPDGAIWRWSWQHELLSVFPDADEDHPLANSALWVLGESGKLEQMARRATTSLEFLTDGRILSVVDIARFGVGDLLVIDPDTLEERLVDTDVYQRGFAELEDGTLLYTVRRRATDSVSSVPTSFWLVRLAPRE